MGEMFELNFPLELRVTPFESADSKPLAVQTRLLLPGSTRRKAKVKGDPLVLRIASNADPSVLKAYFTPRDRLPESSQIPPRRPIPAMPAVPSNRCRAGSRCRRRIPRDVRAR